MEVGAMPGFDQTGFAALLGHTSGTPMAANPGGWLALCRLAGAGAQDGGFAQQLRAQFAAALVEQINRLPAQVPPETMQVAGCGVEALDAMLSSAPSAFSLAPALSHSMATWYKSHWLIAPQMHRVHGRRLAARQALRPASASWHPALFLAPAAGRHDHSGGDDARLELVPLTAIEARQEHVQQLRRMLQTCTPHECFTLHEPAHLSRAPRPILAEALAAEIYAAIESSRTGAFGELGSIRAAPDFGNWLRLSDYLFTFVESRMVTIENVFVSLGEASRQAGAQPPRKHDSGSDGVTDRLRCRQLAWLVCQCMSIDAAKKEFAADSERPQSRLIPFIIKTFAKQRQQDVTGQEFWRFLPEAGLYSILFKQQEPHRLPQHVEGQSKGSYIPEPLWRAFVTYKQDCQIFYEPIYAQDKQYEDVRRFTGQDLARFSTLSHMGSTDVSKKLAAFLRSAETDPEFAALPVRNGRLQPLPVSLLVALSAQCRIRLRELLDAAVVEHHVARGVLETYVRLLFLAPQSCFKSETIQQVFMRAKDQTVVIEMLELGVLRLIRRASDSHMNVPGSVPQDAMSVSPHMRWLWRHCQDVAARSGTAKLSSGLSRESFSSKVFMALQSTLLALLLSFPGLAICDHDERDQQSWNPVLAQVAIRSAATTWRLTTCNSRLKDRIISAVRRHARSLHEPASSWLAMRSFPEELQIEISTACGKAESSQPRKNSDTSRSVADGLKRESFQEAFFSPPRAHNGVQSVEEQTAKLVDELRGGRFPGGLAGLLCCAWEAEIRPRHPENEAARSQPSRLEALACVLCLLGGTVLLAELPLLLDHILKTTPGLPTDLSNAEAKEYADRARYNMALSAWVWTRRLLPISPVILHLAHRVSSNDVSLSDAANLHLDFLLCKDTGDLSLAKRLAWLASEKGPEPEQWNEDRYGLKEFGFQAAFRQDMAPKPLESCGMSECIRFIPTIDVVLGCLLEAAAWGDGVSFSAKMTLDHLIQHVIPKIFPFRSDPVMFLLRFMRTNYHCPGLTVELKSDLVCGVLGGHMLRADDAAQLRFFAPDLVETRLWPEQGVQPRPAAAAADGSVEGRNQSGALGSVTFFVNLLQRLGTILRGTPTTRQWPGWEELAFGEFSSAEHAADAALMLAALRSARAVEEDTPTGCGADDFVANLISAALEFETHGHHDATPAADAESASMRITAVGSVLRRLPAELHGRVVAATRERMLAAVCMQPPSDAVIQGQLNRLQSLLHACLGAESTEVDPDLIVAFKHGFFSNHFAELASFRYPVVHAQALAATSGAERSANKARRVERSGEDSHASAAATRALILFQFCSRMFAPSLAALNNRASAELATATKEAVQRRSETSLFRAATAGLSATAGLFVQLLEAFLRQFDFLPSGFAARYLCGSASCMELHWEQEVLQEVVDAVTYAALAHFQRADLVAVGGARPEVVAVMNEGTERLRTAVGALSPTWKRFVCAVVDARFVA
eukprot:SAG22_NODE_131_length_18561_cov_10.941387_9_plen_1481_part_00